MAGAHDRHHTPTPDEVESLVRDLISMMRSGGLSELDVAFGDVSVRLRGGAPAGSATAASPLQLPIGESPAPEQMAASNDHAVPAPMIGTFYASPSPGSPAFVEVGDVVAAGQTIGIIEAMKIMNEIAADRGGVVTEIVAQNGQPVEYGSPLVRIRVGGS